MKTPFEKGQISPLQHKYFNIDSDFRPFRLTAAWNAILECKYWWHRSWLIISKQKRRFRNDEYRKWRSFEAKCGINKSNFLVFFTRVWYEKLETTHQMTENEVNWRFIAWNGSYNARKTINSASQDSFQLIFQYQLEFMFNYLIFFTRAWYGKLENTHNLT